jgi:hypothetical protein
VGDAPPAVTLPSPDRIPLVAEHHYRLSGSVRPFVVFWINRDNVGGGRMTWRRAADGTISLELLTGSDPARAPFHVNRWGYIREVVHGDDAELIAVKSDIEEETIEQARASANTQNSDRVLEFIREQVTAGDAHAWSAVADIKRDGVSYKDVDFVLSRMSAIDGWRERRLNPRPPEARSGFLVALTELMQRRIDRVMNGAQPNAGGATDSVIYIHRAKLYDLRQENVELKRNIELGGQRYARALQGKFEIRNRTTGDISPFWAIYGIDGPLAGVPLRMTYQPRWWLRTEFTLDEGVKFEPATPANSSQ